MGNILTVGEPMALFIAEQEGALEQAEKFIRLVAGAEVNFAIGMARLGHPVTYLTQLGDDPFGRQIGQFLAENGINTHAIRYCPDYFTGMQFKQKVRCGDPEVYSVRKNSAAAHMTPAMLKQITWQGIRHVHVTGIPPALSLDCRAMIYELMALARQHGVPISYDPNLRPQLWNSQEEMIRVVNDLASHADLVLPGISEGRLLTGRDELQGIADFYHAHGVKTVIIKLGANGAYTSNGEEHFFTAGFHVKEVVDTVGAGDGFAVGVASALLEGLTLPMAVRRGNAIGALAIMTPGDNDGLPDRAGLESFITRQSR